MDDLLNEFLTETTESIEEIDMQLVEFEQNPSDAAILSNIFRLVHTIKGTSGFLGLPRLEKVAHAGEDLLGLFRDGKLEVTPEAVTLILRAIDTIKELLGELEESGSEPEGDDSEIISALHAHAESGGGTPSAAPPSVEPIVEAAADDGPVADEGGFPVAAELMAEYEEATGGGEAAADDSPVAGDGGFPVAAELMAEYEEATASGVTAPTPDELDAQMAAEMAAEKGGDEKAAEAKVPAAPAKKKSAPAKKEDAKGPKEPSVASQSIRVNVELLENLMTLVSELVLTRNQLLQMVRGHDDSEFTVPLQRLSHITTELQEGVMKTRMQPIGNAWAKLPRIVRDLAVESGKKIDLQMNGAETELDRQVLELIKDPLTHMVRNSADHGLEEPAGRTEAGKPETGVVVLSAFHEGGHIIIEIADDGRGLNMDRIVNKILENDMATESEVENMTDSQIQQFIMKAGFSTAEKVTNVSGRGVGMDVVRTNIEKIGGTIELKSEEGKGSTFTIKIPLTLAIVSALIVECASERFAIPQISVLELVRASSHSENNIEMINDSPVLRLRNRLLPLVHLRTLLNLEVTEDAVTAAPDDEPPVSDGDETAIEAAVEAADDAEAEEAAEPDEELFIVVAQVGTYSFGIIVDQVFDTEEIVVKPVAPILRDISFYSGNTILGDGSVIMILDPNGIAGATGQGAAHDEPKETAVQSHEEEKTSMLIFRAGGSELKAVPLALVARLEDIDLSETELSHGQHVVQYRGHLMPLVPFDSSHQFKTEGRQPILVFTDRERSMGLVVDEIVDIVEDRLKVELTADQDGLIGSAIISGKATDVIDAGHYLTMAFDDWFGSETTDSLTLDSGPLNILLVDDSPFFRNLLTPVLSVAGYKVTTVESAASALDLREKGASFDVIISDVEMPGLDGFEFAEAVRGDPRWETVPMIALSSHATDKDFDRGREAGFNDYVAKSNREELVQTLSNTVAAATGN